MRATYGGVQYVGVNEVGANDGGWCAVTLDSGAAASVMPAWRYPKERKRTGAEYTVADGGKIANLGEKLLKFEFSDGDSGNMRFRLANVTMPRAVAVCAKKETAWFLAAKDRAWH